MDVSGLSVNDLRYRCEGNASICFEVKNSNLVLKLFKSERENVTAKDSLSRERDFLAFHENVMNIRFSEKYLCDNLQLVGPIRQELIAELMTAAELKRPTHRRKKTIDPQRCHGLVVRIIFVLHSGGSWSGNSYPDSYLISLRTCETTDAKVADIKTVNIYRHFILPWIADFSLQ